MLGKIKLPLAAMLVAGVAFGAMADVAYAKSGKRGAYRSAPVYLNQAPRGQYYYSPGYDRASSPKAGGVG
jgi:hypothetical protein